MTTGAVSARSRIRCDGCGRQAAPGLTGSPGRIVRYACRVPSRFLELLALSTPALEARLRSLSDEALDALSDALLEPLSRPLAIATQSLRIAVLDEQRRRTAP